MSQVKQAIKQGNPEAQFTAGMIYKRKAPTVAAKLLTDGERTCSYVNINYRKITLNRHPRALRPEVSDIRPPCKFSAADQGHAAAQYELSRLYDEGDGVNQSFGKGREWATKAATGGNLEAQIEYALYLGGKQSEVRRDAWLFAARQRTSWAYYVYFQK